MAGVLPLETAMLPRLKTLGYAEVSLAGDCLWGAAGDGCRGHEFHYSEIVADDALAKGWRPAYSLVAAAARRAPPRKASPRAGCWPATSTCTGPRGQPSPNAFWHPAKKPYNHRTLLACCEGTL